MRNEIIGSKKPNYFICALLKLTNYNPQNLLVCMFWWIVEFLRNRSRSLDKNYKLSVECRGVVGWERVGKAFPHLFCTSNVTWRFRFFISISMCSTWSSL